MMRYLNWIYAKHCMIAILWIIMHPLIGFSFILWCFNQYICIKIVLFSLKYYELFLCIERSSSLITESKLYHITAHDIIVNTPYDVTMGYGLCLGNHITSQWECNIGMYTKPNTYVNNSLHYLHKIQENTDLSHKIQGGKTWIFHLKILSCHLLIP